MEPNTALNTLTIAKNTSYGIAFLLSADFLGFDPTAGAILLTLMTIDVFTGTIRSASVNGLPSIKSSVGTRGLLAKILTIAGLLSIALAFKGVGFDPTGAVSGITSVFILAEAYSIIGNIHSTITKKPKAEWDAVAFLVSLTRRALDKYAGKAKDEI